MPIGKSGNYHMNPHEMRRKGDAPDEKPGAANPKPAMKEDDQGHEEGGGDGNHHHEIHEHEDGTAHSIHIHPDGQREEMEHGSYQEAVQHEHMQRGNDGDQDDMPEPDGGGPAPDGGDDIAGMYASHCQ